MGVRCEALTRRGTRCKNYAIPGAAHCGNHATGKEHFDAELVRMVERYIYAQWEAWGRPQGAREWA